MTCYDCCCDIPDPENEQKKAINERRDDMTCINFAVLSAQFLIDTLDFKASKMIKKKGKEITYALIFEAKVNVFKIEAVFTQKYQNP